MEDYADQYGGCKRLCVVHERGGGGGSGGGGDESVILDTHTATLTEQTHERGTGGAGGTRGG